jgi:hypothetical protein
VPLLENLINLNLGVMDTIVKLLDEVFQHGNSSSIFGWPNRNLAMFVEKSIDQGTQMHYTERGAET